MTSTQKYLGRLPDLDDDRDLFETPELTDDASTRPPESETSPNDIGDDDDTSGINRVGLDASGARFQFRSTQVDAREADFSDRLDSKRKSYRVTSRRRRASHEAEEYGDSDLEDQSTPEGLKRRIARLQREAEELKAEALRQAQSEQGDSKNEDDTMVQLNSAIKTLDFLAAGNTGAEARLARNLEGVMRKTPGPQDSKAPASVGSGTTYTLAYQPPAGDVHTLALAASFDARLRDMEAALGISSITLPTQSNHVPRPLIPALDTVEKQVTLLATTSTSSLEALGKRIRQLTDEAEQLEDKRKAAKQRYDEMRSAASDPNPDKKPPLASVLEDAEMEAKISALYNTLPTIEALAPTLPQVLDRLKSLRLLHADAANAASRLDAVESQAKETETELKQWKLGLEKMEAVISKSEDTTKKNMGVVEGWIKDLEQRVQHLG